MWGREGDQAQYRITELEEASPSTACVSKSLDSARKINSHQHDSNLARADKNQKSPNENPGRIEVIPHDDETMQIKRHTKTNERSKHKLKRSALRRDQPHAENVTRINTTAGFPTSCEPEETNQRGVSRSQLTLLSGQKTPISGCVTTTSPISRSTTLREWHRNPR